MIRNSRRLAASVASHITPLKLPIPRDHPGNVLNSNAIQVSKEVEERYQRNRLVSYDMRARVNHFLEAVFSNDTLRAMEHLDKLKTKCRTGRNVGSNGRNIEVYFSCLTTLASHMTANSITSPFIRDLRLVVDEFLKLPDFMLSEVDMEVVKLTEKKMIVALLRGLQRFPKKGVQYLQLSKYIKTVTAKFKIDPLEISELVQRDAPEVIPILKSVWAMKEVQPDHTMKLVMSLTQNVDDFKADNGSLSYSSLCEFIGTRFNSKYGDGMMFDIYDLLPEGEREQFFEAYTEFGALKQLQVEDHCGYLHESTSRQDVTNSVYRFSGTHSAWMQTWQADIKKELERIISGFGDQTQKGEVEKILEKYSFYLMALPIDTLVSLFLFRTLSATLPGGKAKFVSLAQSLGGVFLNAIRSDAKLKAANLLQSFFTEEDAVEFTGTILKVIIDTCKLPEHLGSVVFPDASLLVETYLIPEAQSNSVFVSGMLRVSPDAPIFKRAGFVFIHPFIFDEFKCYDEVFQSNSYLFPMLCPPAPWTSPTSGGFISSMIPLVRSRDRPTSLLYMERAHKTGQLASTYKSLDRLGSVPWAVNPNMLKVLNEIMAKEDGFMHIPPKLTSLTLDLPARPSREQFEAEEDYFSALNNHRRECYHLRQKNWDQRGLRVGYNLTAQLANALGKNGDAFYYAHNLDFRGRVYPAVSIFSHYGEDLVRSLLTFWKSKPLGTDGFNAIKYQLANMHSNGKLTMEELIQFVEDNKTNIELSASDPMSHSWWQEGDSPFQSLALCMEVLNIWTFEGNIEEYRCRTPIHQDGTCNGLQHYAALGADTAAAVSVNLTPSENRHDVYLSVLTLVKEKMKKDMGSDDENISSLAHNAFPLISRKIVKQTVMTTVYGVTQYGASKQIDARLSEIDLSHTTIPKGKMSLYIAKMVLSSISELFAGARAIQDWLLKNCDRTITAFDKNSIIPQETNFFGSKLYRPMMWTSLAGFPVVQLYKHESTKEVHTPIQGVSMRRNTGLAHIDIRKQLNGIAPNFIHSLDAIHLLMTCLAVVKDDLTFVGVHDSFWTHACDVGKLSVSIREEFVRLHSSNIISNLREDMIHSNKDAFQLVWVANSEVEFISALEELRAKHKLTEKRKGSLEACNQCLLEELNDNSGVAELVEKYKPVLLFKSRSSPGAKRYEEYEDELPGSNVSHRTHTPILVPVKILKEPPTGSFNIEEVLDSKFFFS